MSDDYAARLQAERARKNAEREARMASKLAEIDRKDKAFQERNQKAIGEIKAGRQHNREERASRREADAWRQAQQAAIAPQHEGPGAPGQAPALPAVVSDQAALTKADKKAAKEAVRAEKRAAKAERRAERNAEHQAQMQAQQAEDDRLKARYGRVEGFFAGKEGSVTLKNGYVKIGFGILTKVPVDSVAVSFEGGGRTKRMTATRVIAGGALLGPLGAAAGAALRKDKAGAWIFICDGRSGHVEQVPVMPKEVGKAMKFVAQVEAAQNLT